MKSLSLNQPHAIVMVGIPGRGKTFFATKFSDTFHAPLVSVESILPHAESVEAAHKLADKQLEELLKTNQSLVLEMAASTRTERMDLAKRLRAKGYAPLVVWVQTDPETARQRVAKDKSKDEGQFDGQRFELHGRRRGRTGGSGLDVGHRPIAPRRGYRGEIGSPS